MSIEPVAPSGWTDARMFALKCMWADGDSASQIASALGVTRNAICGKIHRLGLADTAPRTKKRHSFGGPRLSREEKARRQQERAFARKAASSPTIPAAPFPEPEIEPIENIIPLGQRCSLLELNDDKCHWPIGDPGQPDFFFCGGKTAASTPYCGYHGRVAYQPPAARRDRRPARS